MLTLRWFVLGLLAAGIALALFLQRETTANLRREILLLRQEQQQIANLRAERERLRAAQPTAGEMERLRADHTALSELRAEIQRLNERAAQKEVAVTKEPAALTLGVAASGSVSLEGRPLDTDALTQRLSQFAKGTAIDIRFVLEPTAKVDDIKAAVDRLVALEKTLGLRLNMRFEGP